MIGATASRHLNSRRRTSSPNIQAQISASDLRISAARKEEEKDTLKSELKNKDEKTKVEIKIDEDENILKQSENDHKKISAESKVSVSSNLNVPKNGKRPKSTTPRLSISDLPPGLHLRRRRAVEISDHKACVLLHSKLKGMKLEDIA